MNKLREYILDSIDRFPIDPITDQQRVQLVADSFLEWLSAQNFKEFGGIVSIALRQWLKTDGSTVINPPTTRDQIIELGTRFEYIDQNTSESYKRMFASRLFYIHVASEILSLFKDYSINGLPVQYTKK